MSTDSKKRTTKYVLLTVFTILAFTGLGLLVQVYVRQSVEVKKNDQTATKIEKKISSLEKKIEDLKKERESLSAEKNSLEARNVTDEEGGSTEGLSELKTNIQYFLDGRPGNWSVYVKDLSIQEYLSYNNQPLKAASLIKLFIMGAVYDQIEKENLNRTDSVNTLLRDMITVSDNESANELVRQLSDTRDNFDEGMSIVNEYTRTNGYKETSQGRDLRDYREEPAAGENYTSTVDCGKFLEDVYERRNVSESASAEMLELLKNQERRNKIPAGLPEGVISANKTGELSDTENDVAIVFDDSGQDYIICVMSQDIPDVESAQETIQELSRMVYNYFIDTRTE